RGPLLETKLQTLTRAAVEHSFGNARLRRCPAGAAVEMTIIIGIEPAAAAVVQAIAQRAFIARRNDDVVAAVLEFVGAGIARVGRPGRSVGESHDRKDCS